MGGGVFASLCPFLLFSPLLGARFLDRRTIRTQGTWWVAEAVGETWESPWPPGVGVEARGFLRASGAMAWQQGSQQGLQCRGPPARVWAVPTQWGLGPGSPSPSGPLSTQGTQTGPRRGLPQPKHELEEGQLIGLPAPSPMGLPFTLSVSGVREGVDGTGRGHSCMETPLLNRLLGEPGPTSDSEGPAQRGLPEDRAVSPQTRASWRSAHPALPSHCHP